LFGYAVDKLLIVTVLEQQHLSGEEAVGNKRATLQRLQRHTVMYEYRARGHADNNLWLVYSPKTDRDWILPSDRQLVHWIHYLETCPEVKTFNLTPPPVVGNDGTRQRMTQPDAEVIYIDGRVEWHEVKADKGDLESSQLRAQKSAADEAGRTYRAFSDEDLVPHVRTSVRWLKAIAYAAALRGREYVPQHLAVLAHLRRHHNGTVHRMLADLTGHERPVLMGLFVKLAIDGHIALDLTRQGFGPGTAWTWLKASD
jgi:hypothetical protein